jgi:aerobic carbon-monoxide dehydrogenase small subunit
LKESLTLQVNGKIFKVEAEARKTLADVLRDECGLTGTHLGCEHGVCGACTVLIEGEPMRSCLLFAIQFTNVEIRTIEGLATEEGLHPVQKAFKEHHGLQCGFCTPGFIMLAVGVLEKDPTLDDDELREVLASNLCRCTGYQNILKAVGSAAREMDAERIGIEGGATPGLSSQTSD